MMRWLFRGLPSARLWRAVAVGAVGVALAGCSWLSPRDTRYDPVPLVDFTPERQAGIAWSVNVGNEAGIGFSPAVTSSAVYAASANGNVAKIDLRSGSVQWQAQVAEGLQAGAGSDGNTTAVVTPSGEVVAFNDEGVERWRNQASSEVLVPPAVGDGVVVVRSGDYRVQAFDASTGERVWSMQRPGPSLSLRAANQMTIAGGYVFSGLPGGKVVAINIRTGVIEWEGTVAIPQGATELERVADVVGRPVLAGDLLCAAAYQGRIACFDLMTDGSTVWARDLSASAGLAVDQSTAFVSDAKGVVHAYLLSGGANIWQQDDMRYRRLSAPGTDGRAVAVGDFEGYVHFLAREDGRLLARVRAGNRPILAPVIGTPQGFVVQNSNGSVHLLTTGS